jgi:uncharacterized protein YyaL (SSP411 family)
MEKIGKELGISKEELEVHVEEARQILFEGREKRVHPYKDDKILVNLNGLMIAALSKAAFVCERPDYLDAAKKAVDFVNENMMDGSEKLLHRFREGEAAIPGFQEDYTFLIWGLLELYEASLDMDYLKQAIDLNDHMITHFWDEEGGGFFSVSDDGEQLLVRQKESYDGAIPSGNSVAAMNLLRLARITAASGMESRAEEVTMTFSRGIMNSPASHTYFMCALDFAFGPSYEVVIVGNSGSEDTKSMLHALWKSFVPNKVLIFRNTESGNFETDTMAPYTASMTAIDEKTTAYVCRNFACELPTTEIEKMLELLGVKDSS